MEIEIKNMIPLLHVFDMPASMKFYCDLLGFEVVSVDDPKKAPNYDWVWLRLQGVDLMLNTAYDSDERPAALEAQRVAAHEDTCLYFGAPDVDAVYADLVAKGVKASPPAVAPYGMKQVYLHDPDGYQLCFQWSVE
jgi:glyoxylase I family protein